MLSKTAFRGLWNGFYDSHIWQHGHYQTGWASRLAPKALLCTDPEGNTELEGKVIKTRTYNLQPFTTTSLQSPFWPPHRSSLSVLEEYSPLC